ncbi:MAG: hypothetical protein JSU82_14230 [Rhodospirillales bacterium]|nr:MAG: hypothetical protein JSU82_14230 [Rhodospirillales bacterium]
MKDILPVLSGANDDSAAMMRRDLPRASDRRLLMIADAGQAGRPQYSCSDDAQTCSENGRICLQPDNLVRARADEPLEFSVGLDVDQGF